MPTFTVSCRHSRERGSIGTFGFNYREIAAPDGQAAIDEFMKMFECNTSVAAVPQIPNQTAAAARREGDKLHDSAEA